MPLNQWRAFMSVWYTHGPRREYLLALEALRRGTGSPIYAIRAYKRMIAAHEALLRESPGKAGRAALEEL